jgi:hypothetical protein
MLTPKLKSAIAASYEAFSAFPRPTKLKASPYRDAKAILATLSSAPLRELTGEQIGPYAGWAITTVGNARDYRHFLPRIFEIAVTDPVWLGADPPVMAQRLDMGGLHEWPVKQRDAVLGFFRAAFEAALVTHPDEADSADMWCCGLVRLGEPTAEVFQLWRSSPSPNAALNLARLVIDQQKYCRQHQEARGSFWDDLPAEVRRDVAACLLSDGTKTFLQAATDEVSEDDRLYLDAAIAEVEHS